MKASQVPAAHLRVIADGAPDFLEAVFESVAQGVDPEIRVIRATMEGFHPVWHIEVIGVAGKRTISLVDRRERDAMIPLTSIYLADLLHSLREELTDVFEQNDFEEGVAKVAPFIGLYTVTKAS